MKSFINLARLTLALGVLSLNLNCLQPAKADTCWSNTGLLNTASMGHTSTLLPSGKVLVTGGQNSNGVTNRAELYDPATGIWTNTGGMISARFYHTATLLPNGKVLIAGGFANSAFSALTSAELFDPATGTWTLTGSMTTPRGYHIAIRLANGKVLVTGGANSTQNVISILSNAEVFDPSTGTWTPTGAMTSKRAGCAGILLSNGKILVAGGQDVVEPNVGSSVASAELYNPSNGTWTATGSMYNQRADHTATLLTNGKVLVAGGWSGDSTILPLAAELYDPATGTWTISGFLNTGRFNQSATLLHDGKVLIAGGFYGPIHVPEEWGSTSSAEIYDPTSATWTITCALNTARRQHSATLLPNGKVLIAGGDIYGGYLSSAELQETTCPADLDGSGEVDGGDIGAVLLDFGPCPGCTADLDGSGEVDGGDLGFVLLNFGPCQ